MRPAAIPELREARSLTEAVYERVRADILACRLRPAQKLKVSELSGRMDVSLGAVREALSRLSAEGLVVAEAQRGFQVAPVSEADLVDLTNVRIEIEGLALRQSIVHGDLDWESRVVAAYHRLTKTPLRQPGDDARLNDAWTPAHATFHAALVSACPSPRLLQLRTMLYEQAERYRQFSLPVASDERDVEGEHRRLMEAAIARDDQAAVELLAGHLNETTRILIDAAHTQRLSAVGA
jgi:DNA-binding GntR family transcriptional regulator